MGFFQSIVDTFCCTSSTPRWFILVKCLLLILFIIYVSTVTGTSKILQITYDTSIFIKVCTWLMEIAVVMTLLTQEQVLLFLQLIHQFHLVQHLEVSIWVWINALERSFSRLYDIWWSWIFWRFWGQNKCRTCRHKVWSKLLTQRPA